MNVIVVGAGLAGLGAAWRLQQAGVYTLVLEATDHAGGRVRTVDWGNFCLESGAQSIAGTDLLMQLVNDLALRSDLRPFASQAKMALVRNGASQPFDYLSPFGFMHDGTINWQAKLAARRRFPLRSHHHNREGCHPEDMPGDERATVEQFFAQAEQGLLDSWVSPLLALHYGWHADEVAAPLFFHLVDSLRARRWTFRRGLGHFAETLAARLNILTGARVERIVPCEGGVRVSYLLEGQQEAVEGEAVVVAVPGNLVRGLFEAVPDTWAPFLEQVSYAPSLPAYLLLQVPEELELQPSFKLLAEGEDEVLLGAGAIGRSADRRWLVMQVLPREAGALFYWRADDIYDLLQDGMVRLYPQLASCPVLAWQLFRWPAKTPCWPPGYLGALKAARPYLRQGPIFLAGDYLAGPGTEAALADGWECAGQVLKYLGS